MSKDVIELIGIVEQSFPNATFKIKILSLQAKDHELLCTLAGRMRKFRVRILPGDRVKVEITPYDLEKGRITYRFRSDQYVSLGEEEEVEDASDEEEETGDDTPVPPSTPES